MIKLCEKHKRHNFKRRFWISKDLTNEKVKPSLKVWCINLKKKEGKPWNKESWQPLTFWAMDYQTFCKTLLTFSKLFTCQDLSLDPIKRLNLQQQLFWLDSEDQILFDRHQDYQQITFLCFLTCLPRDQSCDWVSIRNLSFLMESFWKKNLSINSERFHMQFLIDVSIMLQQRICCSMVLQEQEKPCLLKN